MFQNIIYIFLKIAKQKLLQSVPISPRSPLLCGTSYGRIVRFRPCFSARFYYTTRIFDFYHRSIYERERHTKEEYPKIVIRKF